MSEASLKTLSETRFSKAGLPRLLIVGCGDVGMRILTLLQSSRHPRFRLYAVTSQAARCDALRAAGAIPIVANLDSPASLTRLAGLANRIVYLAPPPSHGNQDTRSRHLAAILPHHAHLTYVSTTGVYGDCGGALFDETRPVAPRNARAIRRVDAEQVWRDWGRRSHSSVSILRVPGIYAADRLPLERLQKALPALLPEEDVMTSHIHADDLARLVVRALWRARPNRIYHAVDDSDMAMGDYFDLVADRFGLPRPPRLSRGELAGQVSPMMLSFMSESRRMSNRRIRHELGFRLDYPTVADGVASVDLCNQSGRAMAG